VDYIKQPDSGLDFVRLQMAHHVPRNPCLEVRQRRPLSLRFLNSVLSQMDYACRDGLSDGLRRDTLGYCDKRDRFG